MDTLRCFKRQYQFENINFYSQRKTSSGYKAEIKTVKNSNRGMLSGYIIHLHRIYVQ